MGTASQCGHVKLISFHCPLPPLDDLFGRYVGQMVESSPLNYGYLTSLLTQPIPVSSLSFLWTEIIFLQPLFCSLSYLKGSNPRTLNFCLSSLPSIQLNGRIFKSFHTNISHHSSLHFNGSCLIPAPKTAVLKTSIQIIIWHVILIPKS